MWKKAKLNVGKVKTGYEKRQNCIREKVNCKKRQTCMYIMAELCFGKFGKRQRCERILEMADC